MRNKVVYDLDTNSVRSYRKSDSDYDSDFRSIIIAFIIGFLIFTVFIGVLVIVLECPDTCDGIDSNDTTVSSEVKINDNVNKIDRMKYEFEY